MPWTLKTSGKATFSFLLCNFFKLYRRGRAVWHNSIWTKPCLCTTSSLSCPPYLVGWLCISLKRNPMTCLKYLLDSVSCGMQKEPQIKEEEWPKHIPFNCLWNHCNTESLYKVSFLYEVSQLLATMSSCRRYLYHLRQLNSQRNANQHISTLDIVARPKCPEY